MDAFGNRANSVERLPHFMNFNLPSFERRPPAPGARDLEDL